MNFIIFWEEYLEGDFVESTCGVQIMLHLSFSEKCLSTLMSLSDYEQCLWLIVSIEFHRSILSIFMSSKTIYNEVVDRYLVSYL